MRHGRQRRRRCLIRRVLVGCAAGLLTGGSLTGGALAGTAVGRVPERLGRPFPRLG
jgi:hypothetical protein